MQRTRPGAREQDNATTVPVHLAEHAVTVAAPPPSSSMVPQTPVQQGDPLPRGSVLGRYVILDPVGAGGMGEVYAAIDPELDRKVALKLVKESSAGSQSQSNGQVRLQREAQAMAKLSHPNVVPVYDVGVMDGRVFLAMEFIGGATLKHWMKEGPRPWKEVLALFLQAGKGLAAAHGVGVVHRDFKPDNVLLGQDGRVLVSDFGLARSSGTMEAVEPAELDSQSGENVISGPLLATPLTQANALMGTPAYMAPEQFLGKPADARTDQFSFCVALHEALYGKRPFQGRDVNTLRDEVLAGRVRPAPEGTRVPLWVRRIVLRGLCARPEARYPTLDALLAHLSKDPSVAQKKWWVRAAAAAVLLASGGAILAVDQRSKPCQGAATKLQGVWDEERKTAGAVAFVGTGVPGAQALWDALAGPLDRYSQAWVTLHTQVCEATRVRGDQADNVLAVRMECLAERLDELRAVGDGLLRVDAASVGDSYRAPQSLTPLSRCSDVPALVRRIPLPKDPAVQAKAEALRKILHDARVLALALHIEEAYKLLSPVLEQAKDLQYPPLQAQVMVQLAHIQRWREELPAARALCLEALHLAESSEDEETAFGALNELVVIGELQGTDYHEALAYARMAEAVLQRIKDKRQLEAFLLMDLGNLHVAFHHLEEAQAVYTRALAVQESLGVDGHPDGPLSGLGSVASDRGSQVEALAFHQRALEEGLKRVGPNHPAAGLLYFNVGANLINLERYEEAIQVLEPSVKAYRSLGLLAVDGVDAQLQLGKSYAMVGQVDQAEAHIQQVMRDAQETGGGGELLAQAVDVLGLIHSKHGQHKEALVTFGRAAQLFHNLASDAEADALTHEGKERWILRQWGPAQKLLEAALRRYLVIPNVPPKDLAQARFLLARVAWERHMGSAARSLAHEALADALGSESTPMALAHAQEIREWIASHKGR